MMTYIAQLQIYYASTWKLQPSNIIMPPTLFLKKKNNMKKHQFSKKKF